MKLAIRKNALALCSIVLTLNAAQDLFADDAPKNPWKDSGEVSVVSTNGNSKSTSTSAKNTFNYDWIKEALELIAGGWEYLKATPLMAAAPSAALHLPLKALAWEDASGKVWVSYNAPEYIGARHGLPEAMLQNTAGIKTLVEMPAR